MSNTLLRPTRRTLVRGAAWSVPVVSMATVAPAYAASPCDAKAYTLNWNTIGTDYTVSRPGGSNSNQTHVGTAVVDGPTGTTPVTVTFSSVKAGSITRASDNLDVVGATNIGNLGINAAMWLHHTNFTGGASNKQTLQMTFDKDVTGLTFSMTDVDSLAGDFYDRVTLDGTRTFAVNSATNGPQPRTYVLGDGTTATETNTAGPWRFRNNNSSLDTNSSQGVVTVAYAGTIVKNTPITLTYWSSTNGDNQYVFLSNFDFNAPGCA